jgi:hypothetical protein
LALVLEYSCYADCAVCLFFPPIFTPSPPNSLSARPFSRVSLIQKSDAYNQSGKEVQVPRRRSEGSEKLGRVDLGSRRGSCPNIVNWGMLYIKLPLLHALYRRRSRFCSKRECMKQQCMIYNEAEWVNVLMRFWVYD